MTEATPRHINTLLEEILINIKQETISFGELTDYLHERGFGILLFMLALPMAMPFPVPPGINVLLATPLLILTFQQMIGKHSLWLPQSIRRKTLKRATLEKIIRQAEPWLNRLSFFIRPRLGVITNGLFSNLAGLFGLLFALSVCVPLPLTNTVPSLAIALMAIGVLMRDGLAVIGGMIVGSVWITFLLTLGVAGVKALIHVIIS